MVDRGRIYHQIYRFRVLCCLLLGGFLIQKSYFVFESISDFNKNQLNYSFQSKFSEPLANNSDVIKPFWSCSSASKETTKRFIFVHVYKTAGSSIRSLLFEYGARCNVGTTIIIGCAKVSHQSISKSMLHSEAFWTNGRGKTPCINKKTSNSRGKLVIEKQNMKTKDLSEQHVRIIAGHVSIGISDYWHTDNSRKSLVDAQYLSFFRDPIHRYVSGILFYSKDKGWSQEHALKVIRDRIFANKLSNLRFNTYAKYLLTPKQRELNLTMQDQVDFIKRNLISFKTLIGIVERMADSMALLQSVIDPYFEFSKKMDGGKRENISKLSTSRIVRLLSKDEDWLKLIKESLEYEYQVYDFAYSIFENQFEAMLQLYGTRYTG